LKIVVWGDADGASSAAEVVGGSFAAVVAAANRPCDWTALERLAALHGVPFLVQPHRSNADKRLEFADSLRRLNADVFVVSSYSMILPGDWLTIPSMGAVNVHCALLPWYRGANVLNWVLVNGERETGVTIHYIDEGIDTGDILLQQKVVIDSDDTALTLRTKLNRAWPGLLAEAIEMLKSGSAPRQPQDGSNARHWPKRRPEDGRIDWSWPTDRIYNLIRALVKPWPGAFYETPAGRVVIDELLSKDRIEAMKRSMSVFGNAA
jgi:methionyl-tRNA formyltransferase